jgi:PPK2 family polyphosphate:nucleotide phosphotransferase
VSKENSVPLPVTIPTGQKIAIETLPTRVDNHHYGKEMANKRIEKNAKIMADLAGRLYAENKSSVLLVLQGMDAAGKDGTIRTVMRGVNPRSCQVVSFKVPSEEELDHDFLWRVHYRAPRKGNIGIFNRSHYEDVLVARVRELVSPDVWQARFELINNFEALLTACGTRILKCFLHISKQEQRKRLQERIDDVNDHWKFNLGDLDERKLWDEYLDAYEDALNKCNTVHAPWYVIPADQKWYRNLVVSELLRRTLEELNPSFPAAEKDFQGIVIE